LKPEKPIPQTAYPVPCGNGVNPDTKIHVGFSYDAKARPWVLPKKQAAKTTVLKKFTEGAKTTYKSVIREMTKLMVLATRLGTDGYKSRQWVGGCICSVGIGYVKLSVFSAGDLIVPDEELKKEESNPLVKNVKKAISKVYDVLEIACMEVQRQKQKGSIGIATTVVIPGLPVSASMTMVFDITTSCVVDRAEAYMKSAGACDIFDGII